MGTDKTARSSKPKTDKAAAVPHPPQNQAQNRMINNHGKKNNIATSREAQALVGNKRRLVQLRLTGCVLGLVWRCFCYVFVLFPFGLSFKGCCRLDHLLFLFVCSFVVMDDCTTSLRHCVSVLPPPLVCSCI